MFSEVTLNSPLIESGSIRKIIDNAMAEAAGYFQSTYGADFEEIYKIKPDANNLFYFGFCEKLTNILLEKLQAAGLKSFKANYDPGNKPDLPHSFAVFEENGVLWLIDMTWQQFLNDKEKPNYKKPKVLLCKVSDIELALEQLGIPKNRMKVWTQALRNLTTSE